MRFRVHGDRIVGRVEDAAVLDAAPFVSETIPEKVTVAEILERNRKLWMQGLVAPAMANKLESDALRAMNAANRRFWATRQERIA